MMFLRRYKYDPSLDEDICRDERCDIDEVHMQHIIIDSPQAQRARGWKKDPFEQEDGSWVLVDKNTGRRVHTSTKENDIENVYKGPWSRHSQTALYEHVAAAISSARIKVMSEIHQDVINSYGNVNVRSVYRHVSDLVASGFAVRIEINKMLGVYVRQGSPLLKDCGWIFDQMEGSSENLDEDSILDEFDTSATASP